MVPRVAGCGSRSALIHRERPHWRGFFQVGCAAGSVRAAGVLSLATTRNTALLFGFLLPLPPSLPLSITPRDMVLDPNKPLDELVKTTAVGRGRGRGGRAAARGGRGGAGPAANGGAASTGRGRGAARGRGRGRGAAAPTGRGAAKAGGARAAAAPVKAAPKLTVTVLNNRAARPAGLGPRQQQLAAIGAAAGIGAVRGAQAAV